jgi:hypothetical protein
MSVLQIGVPIGNPVSPIEAALTYGGDYQLTPSNDLATVQDTPFAAGATIQRVTFLILTNPALPNLNGNGTAEPDDMFNPNYGAGARAYVGRNATQANLNALQRNILNGLALDPFIANSPKPTVTFRIGDASTVLCTVTFRTITGQLVTIPDLAITGANAV